MRVCKQGWPFIIGCFIVGSMVLEAGQILHRRELVWIAGLCFLGVVYCAYFFRDPQRIVPSGDRWILAPADGKILEVVQTRDEGTSQPVWMIRIFLSIFDPHLQRSPMAGRVQALKYRPGKFLDARDPQAAFENEQNRVEIIPESGSLKLTIVVTQIAGLIARRIVCWVNEGQRLAAGERFGLIRFGSQVDIAFPMTAQVRVKAGDRVKAGETILAEVVA